MSATNPDAAGARLQHPTSFKAWLVERVRDVLSRRSAPAPWILWCDPRQEWRELLSEASEAAGFELWTTDPAPGAHGELVMRYRFAAEPVVSRVIWLPNARSQVGWFKVFELRATSVWEQTLLEALREYGAPIRREDEAALLPLLAHHAREWFSEPKERWSELSPNTAKGALIDDERMFLALAGQEGAFAEIVRDGRFEIFARRAVEDFGFPAPTEGDETGWRVASLARLLATEAAEASPGSPPAEGHHIIASGPRRERALGLLRRWQTHIECVQSLEALAPIADKKLGLPWWARNAKHPPRSRMSRAVEQVLFEQMVEKLERIEDVDLLVQELERLAPSIVERTSGFWSRIAQHKVPWPALADLARAACMLTQHQGVENTWRTAADAVAWYIEVGWRLDAEAETLFVENDRLPPVLQRLRSRLRRSSMRGLDRIGRRFSELLAANPAEVLGLPSAGELAQVEVDRRKGPMALIFLDACRFDLGCRLAELLNQGEPQRRAEVKTAVAPLPSVTALGMAFALPIARAELAVGFAADGRNFRVEAKGFSGDLSQKQQREKWLASRLKAAEMLTVNDVLEDRFAAAPPRSKRLVVVHGAEFDKAGHEGELELKGGDADVSRYARAIRRLRDKGYSRVVVVTDHGFYHWQPDDDEKLGEKPAGEVRWSSRRAIVGTGLSHRTALVLPVPQSELQVASPRSVAVWSTYGGLGFFHGGAMLQELIIPVLVAAWPSKTAKVGVVLKPVGPLTSRRPRVEVQLASGDLIVGEGQVGRRVAVRVQDQKGRVVFFHADPLLVETPSSATDREPKAIQLELVATPPEALGFNSELVVILRDADDEEELARETVALKVEIDDWD